MTVIPTLDGALWAFLQDCEARSLTAKTMGFYRLQLGAFLKWCARAGISSLSEINAPLIRSFLIGLHERGLSLFSQHAAARSLRAWFMFLDREDLLPGKNPMRQVRMPRLPREVLPCLSRRDVSRLLAASTKTVFPARDRAILMLLVDTGVRASELCALVIEDVAGPRVLIRNGKGRKGRVVFMGPAASAALDSYLRTRAGALGGEPLFLSGQTGESLTYNGLRMLCQRLGTRAAVKGCHPHAFRRTFAIESLRHGMDVVRLARLLGHADLQMVTKYLPLVEEDLAAAHAQHGPGDFLAEDLEGA